jgi:hypothetical protein
MIPRMRSFLIIALAAGCSHKSAPTGEWCLSYLNDFRAKAASDILALNDATHRDELLAMVGADPARTVAFNACSDADEDTDDKRQARGQHVVDAAHAVTLYVLTHVPADPKDLQALVTQLADAYTVPM